jgi:Domain of unknown function (DUF4397)
MNIRHISMAAVTLFAVILIAACGEKNVIQPLGEEAKGTRVKFLNNCSNCPSVNVLVGGKFVTGVALAYNGTFPSVGYAVFPAGDVNFDFSNSVTNTSVLAGKITGAGDNKYYTVFLSDTVPTPTAIITEDPVEAAKEDTTARIRFYHGTTGPGTKTSLDLVRKIDNKVVYSGIQYGKVTNFDLLNQGNLPDSFFIRPTGTTTAYPGTASVIATWAKGRSYTIYSRGVFGKTTGTQIPALTFYTSR